MLTVGGQPCGRTGLSVERHPPEGRSFSRGEGSGRGGEVEVESVWCVVRL